MSSFRIEFVTPGSWTGWKGYPEIIWKQGLEIRAFKEKMSFMPKKSLIRSLPVSLKNRTWPGIRFLTLTFPGLHIQRDVSSFKKVQFSRMRNSGFTWLQNLRVNKPFLNNTPIEIYCHRPIDDPWPYNSARNRWGNDRGRGCEDKLGNESICIRVLVVFVYNHWQIGTTRRRIPRGKGFARPPWDTIQPPLVKVFQNMRTVYCFNRRIGQRKSFDYIPIFYILNADELEIIILIRQRIPAFNNNPGSIGILTRRTLYELSRFLHLLSEFGHSQCLLDHLFVYLWYLNLFSRDHPCDLSLQKQSWISRFPYYDVGPALRLRASSFNPSWRTLCCNLSATILRFSNVR